MGLSGDESEELPITLTAQTSDWPVLRLTDCPVSIQVILDPPPFQMLSVGSDKQAKKNPMAFNLKCYSRGLLVALQGRGRGT